MPQLPMNKITPMAAAVTAALCSNSPVFAQSENSALLEEVIVTARKRVESVQDIPASIQAISAEDIKDMNARGLADYSRFVPSVNVVSYGNGTSNIVFRGANVDGGGYVAQATASMYLDEVSVTATGSQPSVRMVDIARVEALSGPQGTLYGSDAQAGTMRIITNKPVMNTFEAVLDGSYRGGEDSEDSYDGSIVLNLPLVDDKLALRLVGFSAKDGGYIDNVFGHTPDFNTVKGPGHMPSGYGTLDNSAAVKDNWNDSEIEGWRAALLWEINDNWSATAMYLHQNTESGALNDFDPYVGDLQTVRFNDEFRDDEYDLYSLTIEGDLGWAQLVSATSYFERDIEQTLDNTAYAHYWAALYCNVYDLDPATYYWYYSPPEGGGVLFWGAYCQGATAEGDYLTAYDYPQTVERFTQEIRLSAQGETIDWLVGLFYDKTEETWVADFAYPTENELRRGDGLYGESVSADFSDWYYGTPAGTHAGGKEWWYSENDPEWENKAVFGEVTWHASDKLDLTIGARYFERTNEFTYIVCHPDVGPCESTDGGGEDKEWIPKVALAYSFTDDVMGYALWTVGYRPGGTNRARGEPAWPVAYDPDEMTNWEAGIKTNFADGAARFNATVFYMEWDKYQYELTDPSQVPCPGNDPNESIAGVCGQPWQTVIANAGEASITGLEFELDWAVSANLLLGINGSFLDAQTETSIDLTQDGSPNIFKGDRLPVSPEVSGAAWAEYNFPIDRIGGNGFARLQWSYTSETFNTVEQDSPSSNAANPQIETAAFDIGDFSAGVRGDTWEVNVFVSNLTDERAEFNTGTGIFEDAQANIQDGRAGTSRVYTNRPREVGFRVIKRWGG
jgi:iron complex outermembrane receptor protein